MNNEENLIKIKKIRNNLNAIKNQLSLVTDILDKSIVINNNGFRHQEILNINTRLNNQLNNINKKIIPKIENI